LLQGRNTGVSAFVVLAWKEIRLTDGELWAIEVTWLAESS
jgi:hypothetical protein